MIVPTAGWSQATSDSTRLDELARAAARQFSESRVEEEQTRPNVLAQTATPNVELTLDEATARSLERNLDIAVERLNPQLKDFNLARLRACRRPTASSTIGHRAVVQPPTNQLNGGNIVQNDTSTYNAGITQVLPWEAVTSRSSSTTTSRSPRTSSPTSTRPIRRTSTLRSASRCCATSASTARQQLRVTAINREISDIQLRGTIATTLANVRNSYWELVFAVQAVDVARGSLDLALKLVDDNRARVEVGTLAPLDVVQAEAEAATRRQALAQAEATLGTAELTLKRLIVNGTDDPLACAHHAGRSAGVPQ